MNQLRFLKLKFSVQALEDYKVRSFIGSQIRGSIGKAMVDLFCPKKDPVCGCCTLQNDCIYSNVFKPVRRHPEFTTSPAPFVIGVDEPYRKTIKKKELLCFCITLFGERITYARQIIRTAEAVFQSGEQEFNRNFFLKSVESVLDDRELWKEGRGIEAAMQAALWTDICEKKDFKEEKDMHILIEWKTPLLTKNEEHRKWSFGEFMDAVFYRTASMIDLYESEDIEFVLPYGILFRKPYIEMLSFEEKNKMIMECRGRMARYMPYIRLGEILHLGKKTTYGFGEYRCHILQ